MRVQWSQTLLSEVLPSHIRWWQAHTNLRQHGWLGLLHATGVPIFLRRFERSAF